MRTVPLPSGDFIHGELSRNKGKGGEPMSEIAMPPLHRKHFWSAEFNTMSEVFQILGEVAMTRSNKIAQAAPGGRDGSLWPFKRYLSLRTDGASAC